jgi:hypothetical protein
VVVPCSAWEVANGWSVHQRRDHLRRLGGLD